jgi:ribose transport system substrate-binding protein
MSESIPSPSSLASRRDFLQLLGLGSAGLAMAGCHASNGSGPATKKIRAALSTVGLASAWCARGVDTARMMGEKLGVDVTVFDGQLNVAKQRSDFEQIAAQDWDFVMCQPFGLDALIDPVKQLTARGIPVIDLDTRFTADLQKIRDLGVVTVIEPDHHWMAAEVTKILLNRIGNKGQIVHTIGSLTHSGSQARAQAFQATVKGVSGVQVVDETAGDWDPVKTRRIWEDLLVKYPQIKGGFLHSDEMALGAYEAVKAAGKEKDIVLVGIDGMTPALKAVIDGRLASTAINPTGRIHGTGVWVGWNLATGQTKREDLPLFIRADGPLVTAEIAPGLIWLSDHLLV